MFRVLYVHLCYVRLFDARLGGQLGEKALSTNSILLTWQCSLKFKVKNCPRTIASGTELRLF